VEAPPYASTGVEVVRLPGGSTERDAVAVEEPLEIRIGGGPVAVTMRTPGHDEELALGFCLSEGLRPVSARLPDDLAANTVDVDAPAFDPARVQRSFYTSSSCGVCGKGALDAVAVEAPRVASGLRISVALAASLQLIAALPHNPPGLCAVEPLLEFDRSEHPIRMAVLREPIEQRDGWVDIPQGPGLGIDIDRDALARYAV